MANNTTAVVKGVYPIIEARLNAKGGVNKYKACVQRYLEARPQIFSSIPNNRLFFGEEQINDFYTSMGITAEQITEQLKNAFYWKMNYSPVSAKDPLTVSALTVIRYFVMKNDKKNAELASIYFACTGKMYPSAHFNSFRFLPANADNVMNYVVNTQMSGKFDLKTEGSIFGVLKKICNTWLTTYNSRIKRLTDDDVGYVIKQLSNRIKSFLKNFAREYYKAYDDKDFLNFSSDDYSEDNYRISDTDSIKAERYTEVTMTYITSHGIDYGICTNCADQYVKKDEIKEIMESILSNPANLPLVKELVGCLISDYMRNSSTKDVRDLQFIAYSITMKPNAKDKTLMRIKEIVYTFLEDNSAGYRRRKNREATKNSYYRAVLEYITMTINKANM